MTSMHQDTDRTPAGHLRSEIFRQRREAQRDDVLFLLEQGASPAEVADRLNTTASALARTMYRQGLHEVAQLFDREARRARRASRGAAA